MGVYEALMDEIQSFVIFIRFTLPLSLEEGERYLKQEEELLTVNHEPLTSRFADVQSRAPQSTIQSQDVKDLRANEAYKALRVIAL